MKTGMKMKKSDGRKLKQSAAVLLTVALLSMMCMAAFAADIIDPDRTDSVSLIMETSDGEAVSGGTLVLYRVAEVYVDETGQNSYQLTDDFTDSGADLEDFSSDTLASTLDDFVKTADPAVYSTAEIGEDGYAAFEDLPTGVYFMVQTEAASGYYAVSSVVVTVPMDINGKLVYDVDVSPKVETAAEVPEETTTTPTPTPAAATPTPETTTETEVTTLPQTGAILWPVILLAGFGLAFLISGCLLLLRDKQEKEKRGLA